MVAVGDTTRLRVEVGARTDVTNESYYEDAFIDTTFLGRRRVSTPEWRHSTFLAGSWIGTRDRQASQYQLLAEASYGDLLQRGFVNGRWKSSLASDWTVSATPTLEYRHDQTFGRDLEEWRGAANLGVRRRMSEATSGELGLRGDFLSAHGKGDEFLLDRHTGGVSAALDHLGLLGSEWRLAHRLVARVFPDSAERDHFEHLSEGRVKWSLDGGSSIGVEGFLTRRMTRQVVSVSRDNFWNGEAWMESRWFAGTRTPLEIRLGGEAFRYDLQDSTLFFNYDVVRGQLAVTWEKGDGWSMSFGPRLEAMMVPLNPDEAYREVAGILEIDHLGGGSWWSVGPVAGWRDYDGAQIAGPGTPALHSPYAFYELNLLADQVISSRVKLRALASVRVENHLDPSQNAVSVLASGELRWR